MSAERKQRRHYGPGGFDQRAGAGDGQKSYADKVDLNDLDWEDRERVLRLLFSKMNAGVAPMQQVRGAHSNMQDERNMAVGPPEIEGQSEGPLSITEKGEQHEQQREYDYF